MLYPSELSSLIKKANNDLKKQFKFLILVMLSIIAIIFVITSIIEISERFVYNNFLIVFFSILSVISLSILIKTIKNKNQLTSVWQYLYFFIAMICWLVGESSYSYLQMIEGDNLPYPGIPEIFFFTGYFFLVLYFYMTFQFWKRNNTIKTYYIIIACSLTIIIISIAAYITIINEINDPILLITDLVYYIFDGIILFPSISILLSVIKKDPVSIHRILISLFTISTIAGDFGYFYLLSSTNEEIAAQWEWLWVMLYAFSYMFVAFAGLWYSRIILLTHKHNNAIIKKNQNRFQTFWNLSKEQRQEEDVKQVRKLIHIHNSDDFQQSLIKLTDNAQEISLLYLHPSTSSDKQVNIFNKLIDLLFKMNNPKIRILLPNYDYSEVVNFLNVSKNIQRIQIRQLNNSQLNSQFNSPISIIINRNCFIDIKSADQRSNRLYLFRREKFSRFS